MGFFVKKGTESMSLTKGQSCRIQVLRGLAIVAVVIIHNTPSGFCQIWCRPFINFPVGTFLFLSGMLSGAGRWNPFKRIVKVAIPYIIWTFLYVLLRDIKSPGSIPFSFVKCLMAGNSAAVMYYVFVYVQLTLLIPLIDKLSKSHYKWLGLLVSPLEIACFRTLPLVTGVELGGLFTTVRQLSCLGWFVYFYLGYLLGNGILTMGVSTKRLILIGGGSIALQILEGYWLFTVGESNCGTQLKLTAMMTTIVFALLAYRYIFANNVPAPKLLHLLGDCSFGIYFSHLAVMHALGFVPLYAERVVYPINAMVVVLLSLAFVLAGRKVLGANAKYLAF